MNIQTIIEKLDSDTFPVKDHLNCGDRECMCEQNWCYHLRSDEWEEILNKLKDSLTSILDGIEKELRPARTSVYANAQYPSTKEAELSCKFQSGFNIGEENYRQEVINIINSHR